MATVDRQLLFQGQLMHLGLLGALVVLVALVAAVLGIRGAAAVWLWAGVAVPVVHQVWVVVWWRAELYGGWASARLGSAAFPVYRVGFALSGLARFVTIMGAGSADAGSAPFSPALGSMVAIILLLPSIWLVYSIARYFGFDHALGADHFFAEHREQELCRDGIFRYVPNAMYSVGFLSLWAVGFAYASNAALLVAAFSHAYIWVHYFCTERPDMRRIYG